MPRMNKAFTKEDDGDAPFIVPARSPLPADVPNYVTTRGLRLLQEELTQLQSDRSVPRATGDDAEKRRLQALFAVRVAELEGRIANAVLVPPPAGAPDTVRFAAHVRLRSEEDDRERNFQIVGVDEADAARGRVGFTAPLARAVLGKQLGDVVLLQTPRGSEELEIVAVTYDDE
jgi:transcription elongation factor GreB